MTREEIENSRAYQTTDAAFEYCRKNHPHYDGDMLGVIIDTFEAGVEWADINPKDGMVSLDKACEYLESVLEHDLGYYGAAEFADTFRKVMEK